MTPVSVALPEGRAYDIRTGEVRAGQVSAIKLGIAQVGTIEICTGAWLNNVTVQSGASEVRAVKLGGDELGLGADSATGLP